MQAGKVDPQQTAQSRGEQRLKLSVSPFLSHISHSLAW